MDLGIDDFRIEERDNDNIEVFTQHTIDGLCTWLSLSEESSGTKKIFSLLQPIVIALQSGAALVVDELDAKLHPLLLRHIIQLFCDRDINRAGAQLVFTSHDLATMTSEIFRRDEIWFVAKGNQQNPSYTLWWNLRLKAVKLSVRTQNLINNIWKENMERILI